jgi:hypothetical protein
MYKAKLHVGVEHHKQSVTPDFLDGLRDLFKEEAKIVNPDMDFMSTYVLNGDTGVYINHYLDIYLYGGTLFADPEDFFKQVFDGVKAKSGKDMFYIGEVDTELPDEETRICPTCLGEGYYFTANKYNKKEIQDCLSCNKTKRVLAELVGELKAKPELKYLCKAFCPASDRETEVPEGQTSCPDCKELAKELNHKQKVRNKEWIDSLIQTEIQNRMNYPTSEEDLNHMRLLQEHRKMRLKRQEN